MDFQAVVETFAEAWFAANNMSTGETQLFRHYNNYISTSQMSTVNEEAVREGWFPPTSSSKTVKHSVSKPPAAMTTSLTSTAPPPHHGHQNSSVSVSLSGVRSYPIHCVVVQANEENAEESRLDAVPEFTSTVVRDAFAILPGNMVFDEIIRGALVKLGFAASEAAGAIGTIQIRNWKALPFNCITDDLNSTVEDILGDVSAAATLRIRLSRVDLEKIEWNDQAVRYAVIKLLKEVNQITLAKTCPLPQSMISNIVNSKYAARLGMEKCREFGEWYKEYRKEHKEGVYRQSPNSRLTFHPVYELPIMRDWYKTCPNPSNDDLKRYLEELNGSEVRQERTMIPLRRLKIWWRNEKQRLKRMETKVEGKIGGRGRGRPRGSGRGRDGRGACEGGGGGGFKEEDETLEEGVTSDIIEPMLAGGEGDEEADGECSSVVSETGVVMELTRKRQNRNSSNGGKNGRMSNRSAYSMDHRQTSSSFRSGGGGCFHGNKTFLSEMNPPSGSGGGGPQHPVYVNSPTDVGFHVRYLNDHASAASHGGGDVLANSSPRCHLPLSGLHIQSQAMSPINPHVYHINDGLYSPAFLPCSASSNSTHGGSGSG